MHALRLAIKPIRAIALALLTGLFCFGIGAAGSANFDEAERDLQKRPKEVLLQVQKHIEDTSFSDSERARWLAIGSEAAYALALPEIATNYAKEARALPALPAELQLRLSIAYAQGLDLIGQSQPSIDELMTVVATLEKGAFNPQYMVDALTARASAYYSISNYRASLADLLRAYPLAPEDGDRTVRADVAASLGNVYAAIEDHKHAEQFYLEAIEFSVSNATWVRASIAEYSLASVYRRQKLWEKAEAFFERSRIHSEQAGDTQGIAYAEYGVAQVAVEMERFERAELMFQHSLPVFVDAGDLLPQANIAHGMARIAFSKKQFPQTLAHLARALEIVDKVGEIELQHKLLALKADAEVAMGDYRKAYSSLKESAKQQQASMDAKSNESLSEMRVRFDTERQEQQNELLLKENQLNAATLAEQKLTVRLYIVSVIALLAVLGFLVFLAYRSKQVRRTLAAQALTDELTGVANRRHAMTVFAAEFDRSRRYRTPLAIAMFDLDLFKQINDRFGHAAGDEVLVAFSTMMAGSLRKADCFGRIGGEEFLAILPHTDSEVAQVVMERTRAATQALVCPKLRGEIQPTVSIGVTVLREGDTVIEELVKRADEAVYSAKRAGRNRVVMAAET